MPFGTLQTNGDSNPQFAPPYTHQINEFSDLTLLTVSYRTTYRSVRHLVPDMLELEDEPLVTAILADYGMSTVGSYKEYVHCVEVRYNNKSFDYTLSLILDNESAIFSGREKFGYPKKFGHVTMTTDTGSSIMQGHVERPVGQKLVQFNYTPLCRLHDVPSTSKRTLNLRVIPSPLPDQPPSVRELVPLDMRITHEEAWACSGSISFPEPSGMDPIHELDIVRYEGSVLIRHATAVLEPPVEVFQI